MTPWIRHHLLSALLVLSFAAPSLHAETGDYLEEDPYADKAGDEEVKPSSPALPAKSSRTKPGGRKYFNNQDPRSDAGVFHVAFAAGGNFYIEPRVDSGGAPTGDFYKDFGFQAGAYFDHDYSELDENIPLMLRGFVGYKYILSSVHVFSFDGMVRRMWRWSENTTFGVGVGASAALWYRSQTPSSPNEEIIFLPSLLLGAGFEFNPFMVDLKWTINRFGAENVITGFELYFGFRL